MGLLGLICRCRPLGVNYLTVGGGGSVTTITGTSLTSTSDIAASPFFVVSKIISEKTTEPEKDVAALIDLASAMVDTAYRQLNLASIVKCADDLSEMSRDEVQLGISLLDQTKAVFVRHLAAMSTETE